MPDPLLRDLTVYDTEGTRWAVIQRWVRDIVDAIDSGAGRSDVSTMVFVGSGILNNSFGYFKATRATRLNRMQVSCQTPPVGSSIILTLVDGAGVSLGVTGTIAAGAAYQETVFSSPLDLAIDAVVRCKITQVGSTSPGGYLTVNLL
jgi:hypothetical protein